jgi:Bacterial dnaA  protein
VGEESVPNPIQAPELERMAAVLRKRAEQARVTLPKDVAFYLARNIRSSTRALEGALLHLIAHASMTGTAITLTYTRQVLKRFIEAQSHKLLVDSFKKTPPEQSGTIEANIRRQDRVASDHDFAFWLQTRDGGNNRRVRHELEVNMRESERERLARWDAYARGVERRAKTRKQA